MSNKAVLTKINLDSVTALPVFSHKSENQAPTNSQYVTHQLEY